MNNEKALVDAIYRRLAGRSISRDIVGQDGAILIPANRRVEKRSVALAVERGGAAALLDLFMIDPTALANMGNRKLKKELGALSRSRGESHKDFESELARILRTDGPRAKKA